MFKDNRILTSKYSKKFAKVDVVSRGMRGTAVDAAYAADLATMRELVRSLWNYTMKNIVVVINWNQPRWLFANITFTIKVGGWRYTRWGNGS